MLGFDNSGGPNLTDFPALLVLDDSRIDYSKTQPDGSDVYFTTADDVIIPHDIESWVDGGPSYVWVLVPSIPADSTTQSIHMLYGGEPRAAPNRFAVWSPSYLLVYHCAENDGAPGLLNSAGAIHAGALTGTSQVEGRVGFGRGFQNPIDAIEVSASVPLFDAWPEFTVETWAYADYDPGEIRAGAPQQLLTKGNSLTDGEWLEAPSVPGTTDFVMSVIFSDGATTESERQQLPDLTFRTWHHLVYTFDGTRFAGFVDGSKVFDVNRSGWTLRATSNVLRLGDGDPAAGLKDAFSGALDEFRVSTTGHADGWFAAQVRAMTDAGFVAYGPEEAL